MNEEKKKFKGTIALWVVFPPDNPWPPHILPCFISDEAVSEGDMGTITIALLKKNKVEQSKELGLPETSIVLFLDVVSSSSWNYPVEKGQLLASPDIIGLCKKRREEMFSSAIQEVSPGEGWRG